MRRFLLMIFIFGATVSPLYAQRIGGNPAIELILREISEDSMRNTMETLVGFGTRHTLSDTGSSIRGIGAARRWIKMKFEQYAMSSRGRLHVSFHESIAKRSRRIPSSAKIVNVVASLAPSDTQSASARRMIIVCGHYDSRATDVMDSTSDAPGADDDGSGTALTLELARVLSKYEFNAKLLFICFAGEEQGLLGSTAWAGMAQENRLPVEAVLSNDIVGGIEGGNGEIDSTHIRIFSEAFTAGDTAAVLQRKNSLGLENDGESRSLARYCKEIGENYVPGITVEMIYRLDRFLRGGDHVPFHQRGYAAVRVSESKENYDHQHQNIRVENGHEFGDLTKFVNFRYLAKVARVNAAVVATLARAPTSPTKALVATDVLEYTTRLSWKPCHERQLAGYVIRWRKTSSPVWDNSFQFTTDTTVTLKLSKDDYLFGIQSVDESGDVSLPAIPLPGR